MSPSPKSETCARSAAILWSPRPGFTHAVQRIWSNAEAAQYRDPCVPAPATPYFNAVPVLTDGVTVHASDGTEIVTNGVLVPVGSTRTIALELFSTAPTAPWSVAAYDLRSLLGEPVRLDLSIDRGAGANGDVLQLTIQAAGTGPLGGAPFAVYSTSATGSQTWFGFVQN